MKLTKYLIPIFLLFASLSSAADLNTRLAAGPGFVGMMGGVGGTVACGSVGSNETAAQYVEFGKATGTPHYAAFSWVATASGTLHEFQIKLSDAGTPTQVLQVALCTSDGGTPPAPTTTCTNADGTIFNTTGAGVFYASDFSAGYPVTSGTTYFMRAYTAEASDTNYYRLYYNNVGTKQVSTSVDTSSWTSVDSAAEGGFRATTCNDWVP